ncbi:MAG: peptidoglycan DD-metalloendopeptidase family protein, partial [Clostridia bacterium]|nr:peptidoglycan DD-metalloendopeptidase family protein [Clostridia bacterium]
MEQLISVLMALLMAFMQLISTFMGGFGGDTKKLEFTWPVPSESKIQTDYEEGKHDGIDIVLTKGETDGSQVLSAEEGTVAAVVKGDAKLGNYFIIDHKTVQTIYANCGEINVANGTPVIKGQILATIGKSAPGGNAYLHFAVQEKQDDGTYKKVNPSKYVKCPYTSSTPTNPVNPLDPSNYSQTSGTFTFKIYGWGHGVGMSQEGAIAMANQGKTYKEIITHYYPGVTVATDPDTPATVNKPGVGTVSLLEFICRTVCQEIGPSSPTEALKAQAVACYTYTKAFGKYTDQSYNTSYKYSGTNLEKAVMAVLGMTKATDAPKAQCAYYNGKAAQTVYFASSAGKTASSENAWGGEIPYLCGGVSSPEEVPVQTRTYTS